jgi:hypothetical protein
MFHVQRWMHLSTFFDYFFPGNMTARNRSNAFTFSFNVFVEVRTFVNAMRHHESIDNTELKEYIKTIIIFK